MGGLVAYASSDEEDVGEEALQDHVPGPPKPIASIEQSGSLPPQSSVNGSSSDARMTGVEDVTKPDASSTANPSSPQEPIIGPMMGPSRPPDTASELLLEATPSPQPTSDSRPLSPYSANRALLRDLTLPPVPNLDIPSTPPGTPPPTLEALNTKFTTLLEMKRKNGTHFNARLAQSSALRNPALMDKLLEFVGVETGFGDGNGAAQYATTLPKELWDPEGFPDWAYRGPLRKAQEKVQKERERGKEEPVEFVAAAGGAAASTAGGAKRKTRFDT